MAVDHPNEFITAVSTSIIALFTFVLAISTIKLWRAGERHSERELRAYVGTAFARETLVQLIIDQPPSAKIIIKNFGQSPAYDVSISVKIAPGDYPLTIFLPEPDSMPGRASYIRERKSPSPDGATIPWATNPGVCKPSTGRAGSICTT
jgi:hypothetical protein